MTPTALVLDDNRLNLDVLRTLLEREGLQVRALESPRQLFETLEETAPAVIFLDLEFPNHDGFEIFKELRADARWEQVPIVAYTAHTSEIDVVRKAGFNGFLGKPLNTQRFPMLLQRILNGQSVWEA